MSKKHLYVKWMWLGYMVCLFPISLMAYDGDIKVWIKDERGVPLPGVSVILEQQQLQFISDSFGYCRIDQLEEGKHRMLFQYPGKKTHRLEMEYEGKQLVVEVVLQELTAETNTVYVYSKRDNGFGKTSMGAIEQFGIYEGKKTEVIELSQVMANIATNNARQVYAKITGLNIWESDGAGLQLGIGGRGLSPNRTANFNVRQNGYDISADALGYPESYYTPPLESLDRIELVRGAASLQYGTQFGGMLNFRFKKGATDRKADIVSRQTVGSWGFLNSFNSVGGTVAQGKLNYYTFLQYKKGDGFRPYSGFNAINGFLSMNYQVNTRLKMGVEITKMNYLAQQPGGLTDRNFAQNPRQSFRERNWFEVDWNMASLCFTYKFSEHTQLNSRNFGLLAHRNALGNLERIHVADFGKNRTLISGHFKNIGNETRLLHKYQLGDYKQALLVGTRVYNGVTTARQGDANASSGPDFYYLNPHRLENSDYAFRNQNISVFAENMFTIAPQWTLTPGLRFEHIGTFAEGYYMQRVFDGAGNMIVEHKNDESMGRNRDFLIAGIGTNYVVNQGFSVYANISQNYRAINFSDIRVENPNLRVDPHIKDETGYTADLGFKAQRDHVFRVEFTAFTVKYNDKIGQILRADQGPLYLDYRFRGNISDARKRGVEFFGEWNVMSLFGHSQTAPQWTFFVNGAYVDARYINTQDNSILNRKVEMVPPLMLRTGTHFAYQSFRMSMQFAHMATHFSDATNAVLTSTAVEGQIPAYQVADLSMSYQYKRYRLEASVNNLFNRMYFTRRAEGYPGPGIIPSDGRGVFLTLVGHF
jgi:Fe(3+) dicitrate transport protein